MPECLGRCRVFWRVALRVLLAAAVGLPAAAALSAAVAASPMIETIVVKLRDNVAFDATAGLSAGERAALDAAMKTPFAHVGYARDGALQLQLLQPLTLDAARAAVNRTRLLPEILYANIVPPVPAVAVGTAAPVIAASGHPPVHRMIVKFRDAATSAAASRNEALPLAEIGRLSALAGQPVAHERAMSGGAYVVRLFQALPVDQARALARYLATNAGIEYAEVDRMKQPVLIPNDPLYTSQWHYLSPPAEMGGVNLPPAWDITTGAAGISVAVIDTGSLPGHPDLAADSSAATISFPMPRSATMVTAATRTLPTPATGSRRLRTHPAFSPAAARATARSTARTSPERSAPQPATAQASPGSTG